MNKAGFWSLLVPGLLLLGTFFAYRLLHIPSRAETAVFCIGLFLIPTLRWPKVGVYYLFCLPLFISLFRRMYYLISERPTLDYLMLISDGVSEAQNGDGALFGHDRLLAALRGRTSASAMVEAMRDAVRAFEDGTDPTDDLTVMAVRYLG